jgi:cytochrome P450
MSSNLALPPKPPSRPEGASVWARIRLFRSDIFRSQPERLYRAWMAEMRTPVSHSVLINEPNLVTEVLREAPQDFPKADLIAQTLRPLLGRSVFVANGEDWARARRIIDPAFEGGRLRDQFPAMQAAVAAALERWPVGAVDVEPLCSHLAADIIFRTLFSRSIDDAVAERVFAAFQAYQRAQPVFSPLDLIRAPLWWPRRRAGRADAAAIRRPIAELVDQRLSEIARGEAPDDLATRLLRARDPETGQSFDRDEMVDQVAIFFLAGHETSASALSWALYLLATNPQVQSDARKECDAALTSPKDFAQFPLLRDVMRETLRLYPPVPMMVREAAQPRIWRGRRLPPGAFVLVSPWYLHRHARLWDDPDAFRPSRWKEGVPAHFIPFSAGPRICPGAGFAMMESVLALHRLLGAFDLTATDEVPVPVAHLTVRAQEGIKVRFQPLP